MANFKGQEPAPVIPQDGQDPKVQEIIKKAKGYENVLKQLIHGKKTRDEVINMLKATKDPLTSIPSAAMTINDMGLTTMKQGGVKVEEGVQLVASQYLLDDLVKLGQASGAFQDVDEQSLKAITEDTYQLYIERGLIDKSIDPIQLQIEAEKAMTEEQAAAGLVMGHEKVPTEPSQSAMTEQYASNKVNTAMSEKKAYDAKRQAKEKQSALGGAAATGTTQRRMN